LTVSVFVWEPGCTRPRHGSAASRGRFVRYLITRVGRSPGLRRSVELAKETARAGGVHTGAPDSRHPARPGFMSAHGWVRALEVAGFSEITVLPAQIERCAEIYPGFYSGAITARV